MKGANRFPLSPGLDLHSCNRFQFIDALANLRGKIIDFSLRDSCAGCVANLIIAQLTDYAGEQVDMFSRDGPQRIHLT